MANTDAFESAWERMQAGGSVDAAVQGAGGGDDLERYLERYLATAGALAAFSKSIDVPPIEQSWTSLRPMLQVPGSGEVLMFVPKRSPLMSLKRAAVLVAAMLSMASLGAVAWSAGPGSPLYPARLAIEKAAVVVSPDDANLRRDFASRRLSDLLTVLHSGAMSDEAAAMATSLADARAEALAAGAETSSLDAAIRGDVTEALSSTPSSISLAVRDALEDVIPPADDGSADFSVCADLKGLENAICRHQELLKANPDNEGLQKSLAHLQANLAKQQDKAKDEKTTPPGQDKAKDEETTPPGQDNTGSQGKTTPPGQDNTGSQGKKTPPGQDKQADDPGTSDNSD